MPRLCFALDLHDDAALIAEYEDWHRPGKVWPEITESIRKAGIREMEIFRIGDRLFMVIDADDTFSPTDKAAADARNPRVQEWEKLMWRFQKPLPQAKPGEKWLPAARIFALSEQP
ncbi:MAG TPA: L-rhamnose mutarotase [Steroidobacteraceae bacterium]|nr:L-rhamnose mutarotase [Steroidobacteraceae bacterium]